MATEEADPYPVLPAQIPKLELVPPPADVYEVEEEPVDTRDGPYDIHPGVLEDHLLPIIITKGPVPVGFVEASFTKQGRQARIGEFAFTREVNVTQAFFDVVQTLSANDHLNRLDARPVLPEDMVAKMVVPPPSGWEKSTYEDPKRGIFRIEFERGPDPVVDMVNRPVYNPTEV